MWLQWALALAAAAGLVVALVVFVNKENATANMPAPVTKPSAIAAENRQADVIMRQQQAPHHSRLRRGTRPAQALRDAVLAYLSSQIRTGAMNGPITGSSCVAAASSTAARQVLRCNMVTANVTYPFDGVVEPARGLITFCQVVQPPVYGMYHIPISKNCT